MSDSSTLLTGESHSDATDADAPVGGSGDARSLNDLAAVALLLSRELVRHQSKG